MPKSFFSLKNPLRPVPPLHAPMTSLQEDEALIDNETWDNPSLIQLEANKYDEPDYSYENFDFDHGILMHDNIPQAAFNFKMQVMFRWVEWKYRHNTCNTSHGVQQCLSRRCRVVNTGTEKNVLASTSLGAQDWVGC